MQLQGPWNYGYTCGCSCRPLSCHSAPNRPRGAPRAVRLFQPRAWQGPNPHIVHLSATATLTTPPAWRVRGCAVLHPAHTRSLILLRGRSIPWFGLRYCGFGLCPKATGHVQHADQTAPESLEDDGSHGRCSLARERGTALGCC